MSRKRKKTAGQRLRGFLLFVVIGLFVFNFKFLSKQLFIVTGIADLNWTSLEKIRTDEPTEDAIVLSQHESIIVCDGTEIKLYDVDGNLIKKRKINTNQGIKMIGLDDYFVVSDMIQGNIMILDYFGETKGVIEKIGPLNDIVSTSNNTFVVITADNELHVYNEIGVMESSVPLQKGELLGLDVSTDKKIVTVTQFSAGKENYVSSMLAYDTKSGSLISGFNELNKVIFGAKLYDNYVFMIDSYGLNFYKINRSDEPFEKNQREGDLVYFSIANNGNIYEIDKVIQNGVSIFKLVGTTQDNEEVLNLELPNKFDKIVLNQGKILLMNEKELYIYTTDGKFLLSFESNKKILDVSWLGENRVVLKHEEYLQVMALSY